MKRREFIASTALIGLGTALNSKDIEQINIKSWIVLDEVLYILFPKTEKMPSSKEFDAIRYFKEVTSHSSFDKDDKELLLQGALDFDGSFPEFLSSHKSTQEEFVKRAMQSSYGYDWISKVIHYGLEAMLSDPIYGGNKDEISWKSLNHQTGRPQPKQKYARVV